MPETMILYRYFFEWLGTEKKYSVSTNAWWQCRQETFNILNEQESADLLQIIHRNKFSSLQLENYNSKFTELLKFYTNYRDDIITQGTDLYKQKQEYDNNPVRQTRKSKKMKKINEQ